MGLLREGRDGDVTQVERIEDRNAQRRNARVECGEKVVDDEPDVIIQSFVFRLQVGTFFFCVAVDEWAQRQHVINLERRRNANI